MYYVVDSKRCGKFDVTVLSVTVLSVTILNVTVLVATVVGLIRLLQNSYASYQQCGTTCSSYYDKYFTLRPY